MKNFSKNIALWIIIGLLLVALFNLFQNSPNSRSSSKISFSDFIAATEAGNISEVNIIGNYVEGYLDDGRPFTTYSPNYPNLVDKLNENGVKISAEPADKSMHPFLSHITFLVPNATSNWCMDFFYETNARWRRQGSWIWKIKSKTFK